MSEGQQRTDGYEDQKRAIKQRYLRRAFSENRGAEAIANLNKYHNNYAETMAPSDDEVCAGLAEQVSDGDNNDATFEGLSGETERGDSRVLKAFNMVRYLEGSDDRLRERRIIYPMPKGMQ